MTSGSDGLADHAHSLDVLVYRYRADLHLHRSRAELHVDLHLLGEFLQPLALLVVATRDVGVDLVRKAAEQLVNGKPGDLALEVPESDVDSRYDTGRNTAPANEFWPPHLVPMAFVVQRIAADKHLLEVFHHGDADIRRVLDRRADSQAGQAFIGVYVNNVEPTVGVRIEAVGDRHSPRPAEYFCSDVGNLQDDCSIVASRAGSSRPLSLR